MNLIETRVSTSFIREQMQAAPLAGGYRLPKLSAAENAMRFFASGLVDALFAARDEWTRSQILRPTVANSLAFAKELALDEEINPPPKQFPEISPDLATREIETIALNPEKPFSIVNFFPSPSRRNGKTVVFLSGLGMNAEEYLRIGEGGSSDGDSILKRLLRMGFKVITVDFPGMGANTNFNSETKNISTMNAEIMPQLLKHLLTLSERESIYFMAHSLGGLVLNKYIELHADEIAEDPKLSKLLSRRLTMGSPETPRIDANPIFPILMTANPIISSVVSGIPYQALGKALGKQIPYGALIGGPMSLIADNSGFPPELLQQMFDYATQNFPPALATEMVSYFWSGDYFQRPLPVFEGHKDIKIIGHNDPLSMVEGLYWRLLGNAAGPASVDLLRVDWDYLQPDMDKAMACIREGGVVGIAVDNLRHLNCSCVNREFDQTVWKLIETFLISY